MDNLVIILYTAGLVVFMAILYFVMAYVKTRVPKVYEDNTDALLWN